MSRFFSLPTRLLLQSLEEKVRANADAKSILEGDIRWFEALIEAADSTLIRWFSEPMLAMYKRSAATLAVMWSPAENYPVSLREIQEAIQERRVQEACEQMQNYLNAERIRWEEYLQPLG